MPYVKGLNKRVRATSRGYLMIIKSVHVKNFRCIRDETLHSEKLTALVGPNGSGKSAFLRALDIFYDPNSKYTEEDFYNGDTSQNILITVKFIELNDEEKKLFKKYVEANELTVEKELFWPYSKGSQKYYGTSLQNPEFQALRSAKGTNLRNEYNKLRAQEKYTSFPSYSNKNKAEVTLTDWEQSNPDICKRERDDGQFFGFKEVGEAHLEQHSKFLFIPAVRDASEDATESRGAVISELMDLVVRSALSKREDLLEFKENTQSRYKEIFDPARLEELKDLEKKLSETLQTYVPDSSVDLSWHEATGFDIPMPRASIKLVEDEYSSPVGYTGHGLQRTFILTLLQHLTVAKVPNEQKDEDIESFEIPSLIIGIEEPELYQHPNRQRHLSKVLLKLTVEGIPGIATQTQVIYSTHSPLFIGLERFEQIRIFRKEIWKKGLPKHTVIQQTTLDEIAKIIEKADNKPEGTYTGETLKPRLQSLLTPWLNEGFFAKLVVLVEGIEDRAAILGTAKAIEHDLVSMGISVLPCMGKTCLDRPFAIFQSLGIPVYVIWDSDEGGKEAKPEDNHRMLRLLGQEIEDWPEKVEDNFACFKKKLMSTFQKEMGKEFFDETLTVLCENFNIGRKYQAIKNPLVIQRIIEEGKKQGKKSITLEKIITRIVT